MLGLSPAASSAERVRHYDECGIHSDRARRRMPLRQLAHQQAAFSRAIFGVNRSASVCRRAQSSIHSCGKQGRPDRIDIQSDYIQVFAAGPGARGVVARLDKRRRNDSQTAVNAPIV